MVDNAHFVTIASAGAGLVAFVVLICAALRYFTKQVPLQATQTTLDLSSSQATNCSLIGSSFR